MTSSLIVGGDGLIGGYVKALLPDAIVTTRRHISAGCEACQGHGWKWVSHKGDDWRERCECNRSVFLDLLQPPDELLFGDGAALPHAHVAYICAGVNGIRENEGNAKAWRTNVDGIISVIRMLPNSFIVYISTGAVEWSDTSYARQRASVECGLQFRGRCAIVRPQRVTKDSVEAFARYIVKIGESQSAGVYQWPC